MGRQRETRVRQGKRQGGDKGERKVTEGERRGKTRKRDGETRRQGGEKGERS